MTLGKTNLDPTPKASMIKKKTKNLIHWTL